jgi:hypothetical protein
MMFFLIGLVLIVFMPMDQQAAFRDGKFVMNAGIDPFIAIRPMTTATLTFAKMCTAVVGGFWLSIVWIVCGALWLATPGGPDIDPSRMLLGESPLLRMGFATAFILCLPVLFASVQFLPATFNLAPPVVKKVWKYTFPLIFGVVGMFLMIRLMPTPQRSDESVRDTVQGFSQMELVTAGVAVMLVKIPLAAIGAMKLQRNRLLDLSITLKGLGIWILGLIGLTAIFYFLLPAGLISLAEMALLIAVLLPANRLIWHILLLDKTRHT